MPDPLLDSFTGWLGDTNEGPPDDRRHLSPASPARPLRLSEGLRRRPHRRAVRGGGWAGAALRHADDAASVDRIVPDAAEPPPGRSRPGCAARGDEAHLPPARRLTGASGRGAFRHPLEVCPRSGGAGLQGLPGHTRSEKAASYWRVADKSDYERSSDQVVVGQQAVQHRRVYG